MPRSASAAAAIFWGFIVLPDTDFRRELQAFSHAAFSKPGTTMIGSPWCAG